MRKVTITAGEAFTIISLVSGLVSVLRDSVAGAIFFGALLIAIEISFHGDKS